MSTSPLRRLLDETTATTGLPMKDLTVLATQNDPFRIDGNAGHRDGAWLAMHVDQMLEPDRRIHLRGLHYILVTHEPTKPDGETYRNTDKDWVWLQEKAADAARWLGYVPFDRIVDQRNAEPVVRTFKPEPPQPYIRAKLNVEIPAASDLEPYVVAYYRDAGEIADTGFAAEQPYRLVLVGEKSSLEPVLGPIAQEYKADLYLPTGCLSDTLIHRMAKSGADDGRPMVVFYFSDCDPSGWNMPIEVSRKLQALKTLLYPELEFRVHRVGLTPDQVREYAFLPSTPLKDTERRADAWFSAFGIAQTEIDALVSLRPDLLRRIARDALDPFFDRTLDQRLIQAYGQWQDEAQAALDAAMDSEGMERIRTEAAVKLNELRDEIDAINNALRIDPGDVELPEIVVPEATVDETLHPLPLLDSRWPFAEQTKALIDSRAYRIAGAA